MFFSPTQNLQIWAKKKPIQISLKLGNTRTCVCEWKALYLTMMSKRSCKEPIMIAILGSMEKSESHGMGHDPFLQYHIPIGRHDFFY